MIIITHTHAEGTVVSGTSKGDGAGDILKANNFRFRYGAWRILGSRDRMSSWRIEAAATALRAAGFDVEVQVDDTPRLTADVEAERGERAATRADRFEGYSENATARSAAAQAGADRISEGYPLGQPILVGHHSEGRHRRDLTRMHRGHEMAAEEGRKARYWAGRSESAEISQHYRENPYVTLRRIDKLEAELRALLRTMSPTRPAEPNRSDLRAAQLREQIAFWKEQVEAAEATGAKIWRQADFTPGDQIQCGGPRWHRVIRANKKTLSVENPTNPDLKPVPLPYDKVTGQRAAEQVAAG